MVQSGQFLTMEMGGVVVVYASGDVELADASALRVALDCTLKSSSDRVIISLARVKYFDPNAARLLLSFALALNREGKTLALVAPPHRYFNKIVRRSGIDKFARIFRRLDDAAAFFALPGHATAG